MIVDINHNHLPDRPSTELHVERHRTTVTSMVRLSSLVINVEHQLGVDICRHVGGRIARRHEDALVHEEDNTTSMTVAILMNDVVVHVIVMVIGHHIEGALLEALTIQKEVDTKIPIPWGNKPRTWVLSRGATPITIQDLGCAVAFAWKLSVGATPIAQKAVRLAARAIRRGDNPDNWRQVQRDLPLSPEDPYSSEGVYSPECLKFINMTIVQGEQQETLENLENQLREDMQKREEDMAVATSDPAEEDNAVATSDSTTMQGEAVADPEHKDGQASTAVAVNASADKPAMGLVSAISGLNTNELTWVIDTSATSHMGKDIGLFVTFEPLESSMETAAYPLRIFGKGTVRFPVKDAINAVRSVVLKDVNYVPRVAHNRFSVIKALVNDGLKININKRECCVMTVGYESAAPGGGRVDLYLLRGIGKRECAQLSNGNANTKVGTDANESTPLSAETAMPETSAGKVEAETAGSDKGTLCGRGSDRCLADDFAGRLPLPLWREEGITGPESSEVSESPVRDVEVPGVAATAPSEPDEAGGAGTEAPEGLEAAGRVGIANCSAP
ncbi:unnamed protein product [Phytophthora fragariaefolia]|uniref:Unnamed protein product n=1 Tax=Phytophthora fragariaefolia TaxID=1490495 RepID=A0A9W7CST1_9STRA|nr:unnamed protein product [Phytophthora fragariaefolia]